MNIRNIHQRNTLRAEERLKLRNQIEMLFQKGEAFSFYPLRIVYRFTKWEKSNYSDSPVRVGFSIPKKRFKKAVERNRLRRLLKESWRLQKHSLYNAMPEDLQLHCFLVYISPEMITFEQSNIIVANISKKLAAKAKSLENQ